MDSKRIAIFTVIDEAYDDKAYAGVGAISYENKSRYARRYGYSLIRSGLLVAERNIAWSKIWAVLTLMEAFDWTFVMDADVVITNPELPLESMIDDRFDLIISEDENGLNAGNFFVRNSAATWTFFKRVYETSEFATPSPILESQEAIERALWRYPLPLVKIAPQRAFNSYWNAKEGNWEPGDFLIHFAGLGGERADLRLCLMREYAELVDWS
jgi:galactosyl transferase GMA12/MNN10 family